MQKYIVELIGTFFLALTIGVAAVLGVAGDFAPIAIGSVLVALVYTGGHISKAHYNPAVTLAFFIRGRCDRRDVGPYIVAQVIGAVLAALLVKGVFAGVTIGDAAAEITRFTPGNSAAVVTAEFLFTFALVFLIMNVATSRNTEGNDYHGLAIGAIVTAGIMTVGEISLAGFNPAVSISLALEGRLGWADSWMHFFPQILGGILGAFAFKGLNPDDK